PAPPRRSPRPRPRRAAARRRSRRPPEGERVVEPGRRRPSRQHVERPGLLAQHDLDPGGDRLVAEGEDVAEGADPGGGELLRRAVPEGVAGAHRGAHRLRARRGAVEAEVALHHEVDLAHDLGHAERAGEHAVRAGDAPGLQRRLDDAVLVLLDGVRRAHLGAGRVGAVHADGRRRLARPERAGVDLVEVDHRPAPVGAALLARLHAGPAADATAVVDHEHGVVAHVALPATRSSRTAQTLNSGILDSGSSAGLVSWLAAFRPPQWYGTNTVSGRIVAVTRAGSSIEPRRLVTRTRSPSTTPRNSASRGCTSHRGSGYWSTSWPMRRVCSPDRYWLTTRPVVNQMGNSSSVCSAGGRHGVGTNRARPDGVGKRRSS